MNITRDFDREAMLLTFESIDFGKIIDHPNILIAANFWDKERFEAASTCYRFMRYIDDFVDNYKSENKTINSETQQKFEQHVNDWIASVLQPNNEDALFPEIRQIIKRFHIPAWPMKDFARSMIYDIYYDGFASLDAYLEYSQGASLAPAAIFVHLCGLTLEKGHYWPPAFDVKKVAEPCAIFSYLVHIIRDFEKDHTHNLNYFPEDLMYKNQLDRENLLQMAQGAPITDGFRSMIRVLYNKANEYRNKTLVMKNEVKPFLDAKSQLSLEIVFGLYDMVFQRIDVENGTFRTDELQPTAEDIKEKVKDIIDNFQIV